MGQQELGAFGASVCGGEGKGAIAVYVLDAKVGVGKEGFDAVGVSALGGGHKRSVAFGIECVGVAVGQQGGDAVDVAGGGGDDEGSLSVGVGKVDVLGGCRFEQKVKAIDMAPVCGVNDGGVSAVVLVEEF